MEPIRSDPFVHEGSNGVFYPGLTLHASLYSLFLVEEPRCTVACRIEWNRRSKRPSTLIMVVRLDPTWHDVEYTLRFDLRKKADVRLLRLFAEHRAFALACRDEVRLVIFEDHDLDPLILLYREH